MDYPASVRAAREWLRARPLVVAIRVPRDVFDRWVVEMEREARVLPAPAFLEPVIVFRRRQAIVPVGVPWELARARVWR